MTVGTSGINISTLMGGLNSSSSATSSIYNNLGQQMLNKTGAYHNLLKNYYSLDNKSAKESTSTSKDSAKVSQAVVSSSEDLNEASSALRDSKLYEKKEVKAEDGTVTKEYDMDALYKKVKNFVDSYNDTVDAAIDSNTSGVLSSAAKMTRTTAANENLLSKVGVFVGSDNKLSIDEEAFKKSNVSSIKSVFGSTGGYGYQAGVSASMIKSSEQTEMNKSATYNAAGAYSNNYASSYSDYI